MALAICATPALGAPSAHGVSAVFAAAGRDDRGRRARAGRGRGDRARDPAPDRHEEGEGRAYAARRPLGDRSAEVRKERRARRHEPVACGAGDAEVKLDTLENVIAFAVEAHRGQKDKAGDPYVLHPLRMMTRLHGDAARMAALLHDVVEDTGHSLAELRSLGLPEAVAVAVECLTKREGESYDAFLDRVVTNAIARKVKLADLEDNMDVRRLPEVSEGGRERLSKYIKAWRRLMALESP
ncbi:MAG: bifunctional (p)ppGpp synthetase/guanosine-3',5'-bis(diphosphate) 3'-pyrophosphohydrolase [Deltaproteobacteria bacterium]|nr:bifunctional (p)ppGpp synthetase/guanosine-3',5'-bis(diphosphate) 3'-pyrophosphohydrolase [Deltaproteobacteria bacterium]